MALSLKNENFLRKERYEMLISNFKNETNKVDLKIFNGSNKRCGHFSLVLEHPAILGQEL